MTEKIKRKLKEILVKHAVVAAYVFGSRVDGYSDAESDLDLGVLFREKDVPMGRILALQADLQNIVSPIKVDLIILKKARNNVAFNAISNGVVLFSTDEKYRLDFEENVFRIYHDFAPFMNMFYQDVEYSVRKGGLDD